MAPEVCSWRDGQMIRPAFNVIPIRSNPEQLATPRRLRRVVDEWQSIEQLGMIARITVLKHSGHDRPIIGRGAKHLRFRYPSIKTRTTQIGEGKGERLLAYYNEVATHVVDYECHPFEIHLIRCGRVERYRPDAVRQLDDGTIELIEVKRSQQDLSDLAYREKLAIVAEIARLIGWRFDVVDESQLAGPPAGNPRDVTPRVRNVESLFERRTMELPSEITRSVGKLIGKGRPIEWRALSAHLAPGDDLGGDAFIEGLLARGFLKTDLDVRWNRGTMLQPVRPWAGQSGIRL